MTKFDVTSAMMMMTMTMVAVMGMGVVVVMGAYNEPDWGFQFYLDEPADLLCNHSTLVVVANNYVEWELPGGKLLNDSQDKYDLKKVNQVINMQLVIKELKESDKGVYVCHVYNERGAQKSKRGQLLRGVNLGGPKYQEPFDEYRDNLMVGGLAALVLFVPLVTACFVYKFRFQTKEQKRAKHAARLENTKHQRHLETNGKGAELSEVAVADGRGEINEVYTKEEMGTRL